MGDPKAFLNIPRQEAGYRPVNERIADYSQVEQTLNTNSRKLQASRCMDCGVPFCHWACPIGNKQPEWQDALYRGKWKEAYEVLSSTCDFPEFTGRICPALCEKSCVLKLSCDQPVTIRENEAAIVEAAFREGYIQVKTPERHGKKVAVIGAGPAGLVVANQLKILAAEGIQFEMGVEIDVNHLPEGFDAYCICTGTPTARDLSIPGRELKGIHFALEMLAQQNRILAGQTFPKDKLVNAKGKKVLVIGGGDTGSDCIGTSVRQGAVSVTQIEIMPKPPVGYNPATPWPQWPAVFKTTSSHEEGCTRRWCLASNQFLGKNGKVTGVEVEEVEWIPAADGGRPTMKPTGKKEVIEADMVLLAMGFLKPEQPKFAKNVFLAGDAETGASLVVRAMAGGRKAAAEIDAYLIQ